MSEKKVPEIAVIPRDDGVEGWMFPCVYCKKWHYHGTGLGSRVAHCWNSPYSKTEYSLVDLREQTNGE